MRTLLKFDLFRVVQEKEKHLTPPNRFGVAATFATAIFLVILLSGEVVNYWRGHEQCSLLAGPSAAGEWSEADVRELQWLNAHVTFPYIPCDRLHFEVLYRNSLDGEDIEGQTERTRFAVRRGSFEKPPASTLAYVEDLDEVEDMGCSMKVRAPFPSAPVRFNFIVKGYNNTQWQRYRGDFRIHQFRLGTEDISGVLPLVTVDSTEPLRGSQRYFEKAPDVAYYFLADVQHMRTTVAPSPKERPLRGYQYTAVAAAVGYNGQGMAPGLYMRLRPFPYSIRCTREYDTISHFLVHLCAVAGGVYTVASFLELGAEALARYHRQRERAYLNALNTEKAEKQKVVDEFMGSQ